MIACKQVAKALERGDYEKLPPTSKFFLKVHVKLCTMCGGYHEHVMKMQDTARTFNREEEDGLAASDASLSPECSNRIREALRDARNTQDTQNDS